MMKALSLWWGRIRQSRSAGALTEQRQLWKEVQRSGCFCSEDERKFLAVLKTRLDAKLLLHPSHQERLERMLEEAKDLMAW